HMQKEYIMQYKSPAIRRSKKWFPFFANFSSSMRARFRDRSGGISQNVFAACSFDMRFTFILAGREGSAHDGRVLEDAYEYSFERQSDRYYLGDAGYALSPFVLTPYRGVRYHLKEFKEGNKKPRNMQELFNLRHSSCRNVIERTFGVVKKRFPILSRMPSYPYKRQVSIVLADCTIHNFILCHQGFTDEYDVEDEADLSPIQQNHTSNEEMDEAQDALGAAPSRLLNISRRPCHAKATSPHISIIQLAQQWLLVSSRHAGRAAHPDLNGGIQPVGPSPIAIEAEVRTLVKKTRHVVPRELTVEEIQAIVQQFATVAKNCVEVAGFDGIELHGAGGFLIDSFLQSSTNLRTDQYGGSIEKRARFLEEILEAVVSVVNPGRVGIRYAPISSYNAMKDEDPLALSEYLAKLSQRFDLAYVHVMRRDIFGIQEGDCEATFRKYFHNTLISNLGYTKDEANAAIEAGQVDAVAFGAAYIGNPDLVERFATNAPLNESDPATFYVGGAKGYIDYPTNTVRNLDRPDE
ncbi:hypothetical protein LEN26_018303, partial [Aphanomyces euteiches]